LRLGLALAVVVVFLAVLLAVNRDRLGQWLGPGPPKIESLAVLPLENLTGNPEEDYFVDGVTDGLITHLAKLRRLRVISRTSAMSYKGTNKPLPEIARELNVDAVVSGAVMRSGDRVRINVQLLPAIATYGRKPTRERFRTCGASRARWPARWPARLGWS
jgi:TolB-like protein